MSEIARCGVCESELADAFLVRPSVPVHQNLLHATEESARSARRGRLEMRLCRVCGFVFNGAFDEALLDYGLRYESTQLASPAFSAYVDELVDVVAEHPSARSGVIVEIGCGNGAFLERLLTRPGVTASAVGIDPAYAGPPVALGGRVRFERGLYGRETAPEADAVVCRHVIEHVPSPLELLAPAASGSGSRGVTVFVETPCVEWILRGRVIWDFFYEHCSLFTPASLAYALARAGFAEVAVRRVFGGQYLWAEGTTGTAHPEPGSATELQSLAEGFDADAILSAVQAAIGTATALGAVMVWGAGAKGATLCDLVDRDTSLLAGLVDVNPAKQGMFVGGTGHRILSPEEALAHGMMTAVVLNPNYLDEVRRHLTRIGSRAEVLDLTNELRCD